VEQCSSEHPPHPTTKEALIYFFLPRGSAKIGNENKTNMQVIVHGDYSSIASYRTKISFLCRGIFGILRPKHVSQGLTHDKFLLLLSNFSLLTFGWEIFTNPVMQQSTALGWVVLFVVEKVPYN